MIYEWILLKLIFMFDCEQVKCLNFPIKEMKIMLTWNQNSESMSSFLLKVLFRLIWKL